MGKENWKLKQKKSLPLSAKITLAKRRIEEWDIEFNGNIFVSFSGGKDSTVLAHLSRQINPNIDLVFSDTGLEFPELKYHVKSFISNPECYKKKKYGRYYYKDNIAIVKPKMNFKEIIKKYGYPVISKNTARYIRDLQNPTANNMNTRRLRLTGYKKNGDKSGFGKLANKWAEMFFDINKLNLEKFNIDEEKSKEDIVQYLENRLEGSIIERDNLYYQLKSKADFKVSEQCCNVMKKRPLKIYAKETGKKPIVGTLAEESRSRKRSYKKYGCNAYDLKNPQSRPLSIWSVQDILEYIKKNNLEIPDVYGEIIKEEGKYKTTGESRTGCVFCAFGVTYENTPNRFQRLKKTHPNLHRYCMENLGFKEVLDFINVPYQ